MNAADERRTLLLISANDRFIRKADALGMDVVHLEDPTLSNPALAPLCAHSERVELLDVPQVVRRARALHEEYRFAGVLSNHEPALIAAECAARALGVRAPGHGVAELLAHKTGMRRLLEGDESFRFPWAAVSSREDVEAAGERLGYPLILKPAQGSASLGVIKVDDRKGVDAAWPHVRQVLRNQHRYRELLPVTEYFAEPFVSGREYSVETFSREGVHEVYAVVRKVVGSSFVEAGHVVPAELGEDGARAVTDRVFAFLDLVGLTDGPAHTEVIIGERGIHLVESHPRTAGDEIPELVELVTGRDPEKEMLAHYAGLPRPGAAAPSAPAAAKTYVEAPARGVLLGLDGQESALELPGVLRVELEVEPGTPVGSAGASWERVAQLVAVGDNADTAWETARAGAGRLRTSLKEDDRGIRNAHPE